ncbi:MAG: hypothetical protein CVV42_13795 [Candidatus Riflebacteria bacterium HGW-Riflebacteria-2]|jgi:class 3 adenylate cyclase|nr:MAG: hypothetical protein CVV42_13795 [Candidatus Riflebacteria bacterium HGW-Riflebacteria-2]
MKKAILLILLTLTLFMPPVSIYLAFSAAESIEFEEITDRQFNRAMAELQQFDRLINEPHVLIREVNRLKGNIVDNCQNLEKSLVDGSLEKDLNEHVPRLLRHFDFPVQIDCYLRSASNKSIYKLISHGDNLGLSAISRRIDLINKSRLPLSDDRFAEPGRHVDLTMPHTVRSRLISAATQQMQQTLYNCFSEQSHSDIGKLTLRSHGSNLFLAAVKAQPQLTMLVLAESNDGTIHNAIRRKIAIADSTDLGFGAVIDSQPAPLFSKYFERRPELRMKLEKILKSLDSNPLQIEAAEHRVLINAYSESIRGRSFVVMTLPGIRRSEKLPQRILIAIMFMLSCLAFKLLVEKIVLERGPDLSLRLLLPATFLFLIIQPVFVAAYLSVDFFKNSYANEKSRASDKLASDLRNIDLATLDGFRETLNLARSFSSVERIASYTGVPYRENDYEFCFALLEQIYREKSTPFYSSLSFSTLNRPFAGVSWSPREKKHEPLPVANPLLGYFNSRFQEILREMAGKSGTDKQEKPQSLDREIKDEFSRDFFLQILGSESFYRFRQNSNMLMSFDTKFNKETAVAVPVSYHNQPFAYAAWHIGGSDGYASSSFPVEMLSLTGRSPRVAFRGSERAIFGHHFASEQIVNEQPELFRIGQLAHLSKTSVKSRIEQQENTIISEALSANHSNFTIAGSEILKSYQLFCSDLASSNLAKLAFIIIMGLTLAFVGALYFITPLRELTHAAYQIAKGDYSCRISVNHPDEFARTGEAFNRMAKGLDEGQRLKSFVSDSVRREVASADENDIADRACTRHATIIFSSVCGFSEYQKSHDAGEVFDLLQKHLQAADAAIGQFGGEIDKMIEDKIMIVFEQAGADSEISGRAIKAADVIRTKMLQSTGMPVGIGVNTGTVVAGVMGAANARLSRTVVGDPVNLAARLASLATGRTDGGIVASQQILAGLPPSFSAEKLPISKVKGKTQAVEAYLLQKSDITK